MDCERANFCKEVNVQISTCNEAPVNSEKRRLTDKQLAVLVFMQEFFRNNDQLPPATALCNHFGWKNAQGGLRYQQVLAAKGYIERNAVGKYRFAREACARASA